MNDKGGWEKEPESASPCFYIRPNRKQFKEGLAAKDVAEEGDMTSGAPGVSVSMRLGGAVWRAGSEQALEPRGERGDA